MKLSQLAAVAVVSIAELAHCGSMQNVPGAGNRRAEIISRDSPAVKRSFAYLLRQAATIQNPTLRTQTVDALSNPLTCVRHRAGVDLTLKKAILKNLADAGLIDARDEASFPGGFMAGVFPPVFDEGSQCPRLAQSFIAAPGSIFGGHHSYPGGLAVHEMTNEISAINLAAQYREVYLSPSRQVHAGKPRPISTQWQGLISQDSIVGAPLWHDWAKVLVFQWNEDGSEFAELNFAGNGRTDNYGSAGDSQTGAHHILGLAESMKRKLPADFVITQASAHASPTLSNEYKVVNWLRAAAIVAQIDVIGAGYLAVDHQGRLRLPALRQLGSLDLNSASPSQVNLLAEYSIHNLSDSDFTYAVPAIHSAEWILEKLAPEFGYDPADVPRYNNHYRNVALSNLTAERLLMIYSQKGIAAVRTELRSLRAQSKI